MAQKSKLTITAEYAALRFFCGLVNAIPYEGALALARGLGWLAFNVFRFKRARTLGRIREVFPGKSPRECVWIATKSLQNMMMTGVELIRAESFDLAWMDRYVEDGRHYRDLLKGLLDEGRGVVIMVPHSGNWFMAAWALARYGQKMFSIGSRQRNPKVDAWLKRHYGDAGVLDRDSRDTLMKIHDRLKAGEAFAILPDLRVRHPDVEVDFLGGKANVSHAGAAFAISCGCPILVAIISRRNGKHVFRHLTTLRPDPAATDRKAEARRLTREALRILSDAVMQAPEDWFWFNKRWILEPAEKIK